MNRSTADSPGAVCRIRQTELRGISPRQLLALYEHVKRCCVAEGWERPDGTALTPEAVTLYDLNARASCLQQRPVGTSAGLTRTARRGVSVCHAAKFLTTQRSRARTRSSRRSGGKPTDGAVAYWHCHRRCGGEAHAAGAAHAHAAASSSSWPRHVSLPTYPRGTSAAG